VRDLEVAGAAGPLRARHYVPDVPDDAAPAPLLVFLHGGGFVVGDVDTHDEPCRVLCQRARTHVLSVDYRLAPEHPFPAGLEDALAVLQWAFDHAELLGADPRRVAIGGDSAGGCLSTVAARLCVERGLRAPYAQFLVYPVTDAADLRPSRQTFAQDYGLTVRDIAWAESHYLPEGRAQLRDPNVSPLRAPELAGLCPAVVVTGGFDPLRDEGREYAEALEAAGNQVVHIECPGMVHAFINMINVSTSARSAWVQACDAFAALLHDA
jgi:acetyl esterase